MRNIYSCSVNTVTLDLLFFISKVQKKKMYHRHSNIYTYCLYILVQSDTLDRSEQLVSHLQYHSANIVVSAY